MAEHKYEFEIKMACTGCSGAVDRVLKKLEGVKSHDVNFEEQTASVITEPTLDYATVLYTIAQTGKKIKTGAADGVEQSVEVPAE